MEKLKDLLRMWAKVDSSNNKFNCELKNNEKKNLWI